MAAITAAATADEPAEERNQVRRSEHRPTVLAARPHPGDRPSLGQPPDDDTQKTADKGGGDQRAPSRDAGPCHPVEQFLTDHALLLPPSDVLLYVAGLPFYSVVMMLRPMLGSGPGDVADA